MILRHEDNLVLDRAGRLYPAGDGEVGRQNRDLHVLSLVTTAVNQVLELDEMLVRVVLTLCNSSDLDGVAVLVPGVDGGTRLVVCAQRAVDPRWIWLPAGEATQTLLDRMFALGAGAPSVVPPAEEAAALLGCLAVDPACFPHLLLLPVQGTAAHQALLLLGRRAPWHQDGAPEADDRLLYETIAWQIGLGLNKAQLYAHVSRIAREQSALYQVSRRIQSTTDIESELPNVLEVLMNLVRAERGEIYLAQRLNAPGPVGGPARAASLVAQAGRPVGGDAWRIELGLRRGEHELGHVVLARHRAGGPFPVADIALAGNVADQLAMALENRILLVRDLAALSAAPASLPAPLDLYALVTRLLTQAHALAGTAGAVAFLYDACTDDWELAVAVGQVPGYWPLPLSRQRALLDQVRQTREPAREIVGASDADLLLVVPLPAYEQLIGAFALLGSAEAGRHHALDAKLPFVNVLAGRAAIMIYNVQLQLRAEELLILEEHNRIAQTMHDGLAQTLTEIRNRCELVGRVLRTDPDRAAAELERVRADLRRSVGEVVRVIDALSPLTLDELGLQQALFKLAAELTVQGRLQVDVTAAEELLELPPQIALTLFRAAQEILNNVTQQSGADHCWLALETTAQDVVLSIQHNGDGFGRGPDLLLTEGLHGGPSPLGERIREFGGVLAVTDSPGEGTRLVVTLPKDRSIRGSAASNEELS